MILTTPFCRVNVLRATLLERARRCALEVEHDKRANFLTALLARVSFLLSGRALQPSPPRISAVATDVTKTWRHDVGAEPDQVVTPPRRIIDVSSARSPQRVQLSECGEVAVSGALLLLSGFGGPIRTLTTDSGRLPTQSVRSFGVAGQVYPVASSSWNTPSNGASKWQVVRQNI